ncbi:MAG: hypothetical protein KQA34_03110 [Candidatus Aenigmarchaeota archaeon]|nr:hypothetical protein [Candidatus Aenigmarchaeota archaeon]
MKYKLHEDIAKIKLSEKAVRKLILSENFDGNEIVYYDIEFSEEELRRLKNVVLYKKDESNEIYVIPIGISNKIEEIDIASLNSLYKSLKRWIKKGIKYKGTRIYNWIMNWINPKFVSSLYVYNDITKFVNRFVIENGRIPSKEEFKDKLIKYLNSYDVLDEIMDIINREKLKLIA